MKLNPRVILSICLVFLAGCQAQLSAEVPPALPSLQPTETTPNPQGSPTPLPALPVEPTQTIPKADANAFLWVVNNYDRAVLVVNPLTDQVSTKIELTDKPDLIAHSSDAVWVLTSDEDHLQTVLRLNPLSLQIEASIPIEQGKITCMTALNGALWAGMEMPAPSDQSNAPPPGGIARIDSQSNAINQYLPTQGVVKQIAFDGQFLWVLEWLPGNTFFEKIDPDSLRMITVPPAIPSLEYVHDFSQFAVNPDGIWAISESRSARFLYHVDSQDGRITSLIPLGSDITDLPMTLAAGTSSAWAALQNGKIIRIDTKTAAVTEEIQVNNEVSQILIHNDEVWAYNPSQAILYHLNPAENQVGAMLSTGRKMPPTAVPGPTQIPGQVCEGSYPSHIRSGLGAMVNPEPPVPNRVRVEPNPNSKLLGEINPGEKVRVTEGPVCTEGWVWWKIEGRNGNLIGWTAEGDGQDYWLIPLDK